MDSDTVWHHIDTQRLAVADLLQGLPDEAWRTPSLCEGWTVRDVAAHLTFSQSRVRDVILPLVRSGFRIKVMTRDTAVRSRASHEEIIATIRRFAGDRRTAPGVTELEPLIDVLVHGQDIALPLGIDHPVPLDAAAVATERIVRLNRTPFRLAPPLRGVRLVATDADWEYGEGEVVEGPMRWLMLGVAGRAVARQHLAGAVAAL